MARPSRTCCCIEDGRSPQGVLVGLWERAVADSSTMASAMTRRPNNLFDLMIYHEPHMKALKSSPKLIRSPNADEKSIMNASTMAIIIAGMNVSPATT